MSVNSYIQGYTGGGVAGPKGPSLLNPPFSRQPWRGGAPLTLPLTQVSGSPVSRIYLEWSNVDMLLSKVFSTCWGVPPQTPPTQVSRSLVFHSHVDERLKFYPVNLSPVSRIYLEWSNVDMLLRNVFSTTKLCILISMNGRYMFELLV